MSKEELRKARERLGLSRTDFAAYLGISFWTLCQWETGRRGIGMDPFSLRFALAVAASAQAEQKPLPRWQNAQVTDDMRVVMDGDAPAAVEV